MFKKGDWVILSMKRGYLYNVSLMPDIWHILQGDVVVEIVSYLEFCDTFEIKYILKIFELKKYYCNIKLICEYKPPYELPEELFKI